MQKEVQNREKGTVKCGRFKHVGTTVTGRHHDVEVKHF